MKFENVTVLAKANVYFEGKVISHTLFLSGGEKKTLGLVYPGSFHFETASAERMQIVAGRCRVRLAGSDAWREFAEGASFDVPPKSGFDIEVADGIVEYVCSFE